MADAHRSQTYVRWTYAAIVYARMHGVLQRLLFPRRVWRWWQPTSLDPQALEALLQWMYTGLSHPRLAGDLSCVARVPHADMEACLSHSFDQDAERIMAHAQASKPTNDIWHHIVAHRWPQMPSKLPLAPAAQHQLQWLLCAGHLNPTSTCIASEWLTLADALASHHWPEAAQLVVAYAMIALDIQACAPFVTRQYVLTDTAFLECMSECPHAAALLPTMPPSWQTNLLSHIMSHASGDTCLAYIDAVRQHGLDADRLSLVPLTTEPRQDVLPSARAWPEILDACSPLLSYILHLLTSRLDVHNAPHMYEYVVGHILLSDCGPIPTKDALRVVERARQDILQFLHGHWMHVRAVRGFDALRRWCLKELSDELDIDAPDLALDSSLISTPMVSDAQSTVGMTSAGLNTTRAPTHRGPASMYAAVLNKSAAARASIKSQATVSAQRVSVPEPAARSAYTPDQTV